MERILRSPFVFFLFFAVLFPGNSYGQSQLWTGILSPARGANWSNVGATISTTRTQCVTSACATVSGGTVTYTSINAALASAPANTYVLIPAGTYAMTAGITFNNQSNITLRGSGSNSTFLVWSGATGGPGNCGGHDVCASSSDTNYAGGPSNTANWTGTSGTVGTYTQGATSIILNSVSGSAPVVGQPIILDQVDNQSDNGGMYVGCEIGGSGGDPSTECYSGAAPNGFERGNGSLSTIRGEQQIVTVSSVASTGGGAYTVGITPGIYAANWASGNSPGAWWASNPVYNDAVENISLDHTNGGDGITFFNCQGCWVKGVRSVRGSTTGTGWGHVYFSICNHCTVRDSYLYGYTGDTYGVSVEIASDSLVENTIFEYPTAYQFYNSDCEGCVAGYNFSAATLFGASLNWLGQPADSHGIDLYSLSEGNIGAGHYGDSFHGTHDLDTFFRNRMDGREQNAGSETTSSTVAVRLNPGARYMNIVANILGTIGYHTAYKSAPGATGTALYASVVGCGAYPETAMTGDTLSCPTSLWWGNWDNVSSATRWCATASDTGWSTTCGSASEVPTAAAGYPNSVPTVGDTGAGMTALPASFYYSSTPTWWPSGKVWPIIGPDVSGGNVGQCLGGTNDSDEVTSSQSSQCTAGGGTFTALATVTSSPAMDCYYNVMGGQANGTGAALAFNSSSCYGGSTANASTPQPSAPTGVTGIVVTNP